MDACKIAFISTFPPRECGIATFTQDLVTAIDDLFHPKIQTQVIAMTHANHEEAYSDPVITTINENDPQNYIKAAELINQTTDIECVNIQHEFGIFGGEFGEYLLTFLQTLKKPSVVTMHTVLPLPQVKMLNMFILGHIHLLEKIKLNLDAQIKLF